MRFSHRLFLLLMPLLASAPLLAQETTNAAKNVRLMVSGIVSYTRWPALSGPPKLCIFSSSRFSTALQDNGATSLPYLPVIIHSKQEALQNAECIIGSAFCLIINNNDVRFAVNLDALSRSGVKVNPDVLMLARKKKDG